MRPHQSLDPMSYEAFENGRSTVSDSWVLNITTTMGTLRENLHRVDMKSFVARIEELREWGTAYDVAEKICDEFDLWELAEKPADPEVGMEELEGDIPSWLFYICEGMLEEDE